MKFLMFNMAVIAALVYLVAAHGPAVSPLVEKARETMAEKQDEVAKAVLPEGQAAVGDSLSGMKDTVAELSAKLDAALARMDALSVAPEPVVAAGQPSPVAAPPVAQEVVDVVPQVADVETPVVQAPHPLLPSLALPALEEPQLPAVSPREREVALGMLAEDMEMLYARKMGE